MNDIRMPRRCAVSIDRAVEILVDHMELFKTNEYPEYGSPIWKSLSSLTGGAWTSHNWQVNVRYNRRNIVGIARAISGISLQPLDCREGYTDSSDLSEEEETDEEKRISSFSLSSTKKEREEGCSSRPRSPIEVHNIGPDENIFDLTLSAAEWFEVKPRCFKEPNRGKYPLRALILRRIVGVQFRKQFGLPCLFNFGKSYMYTSPNRKYFLKIFGQCCYESCRNRFDGYTYEEPKDGAELCIYVRTRDTSGEKATHTDKMLMTGVEGESDDGCNGKEEATFDGLYNPINAIIGLMLVDKYKECIHQFSLAPFFVFYDTNDQQSVYTNYCDLNNESDDIILPLPSRVIIGSLVTEAHRLIRPNGAVSGQMFLYCIVISFDHYTLSVAQLLTETRSSETLQLWLTRWLARVENKKPKEIILPYSPAIICACSRVFNDIALSLYVNECFKLITKNGGLPCNLSGSYLRIDYTSFLGAVYRWKCIRNVGRKIRDFYIRSIALLVICRSLPDFVEVLRLICVVASQRYENSEVYLSDCVENIVVKDAREKLVRYILSHANTGYFNDTLIANLESEQNYDCDSEEEGGMSGSNFDDTSCQSCIGDFIENIIKPAQFSALEGYDVNSLYLPELLPCLERVAKQFPLWSALGHCNYFRYPFRTSFNTIFANAVNLSPKIIERSTYVDGFLRLHLDTLLDGC